jgi:transcriptional regulator GlxA family with amidase domain
MTRRRKDASFQFFLTHGCDSASATAAIACLRMANRVLGQSLQYEWRILSETGSDVISAEGLCLKADGALGSLEPGGSLFLSFGPSVSDTLMQALSQRLHSAKCSYGRVGALSSSSVDFLARKRVINGRSVAVHWSREAALRETYPDIRFLDSAHAIDRGLYTVAGGASAIEGLFLSILSEDFGVEFATHVADLLCIDTTRACGLSYRRSLSARIGRGNEAILRLVRGMEEHIEETLPLRDLAARAGVSPRHAERLFRKQFRKTPLQYYLGIRLEHARQLLVHTDMTLAEVALASGFKDPSTFSKKYLQRYGLRPSAERGFLYDGCQEDGSSGGPEAPEPRLSLGHGAQMPERAAVRT